MHYLINRIDLNILRFTIPFALLLLMSNANAQSKLPYIKNIQMNVKESQVEITYDILNSDAGQLHYIDLFFIDSEFNYFYPDSVYGDIGEGVSGGTNKKIIWEISNELIDLPKSVKTEIVLDGRIKDGKAGGPEKALYSVLVPGLGDYFVADHRKMIFKPYLRTVSSFGLIALGFVASHNRYREEGRWVEWVEEYWAWSQGQYTLELKLIRDWQEGDMNYWLFKGDAEAFFLAGGLIWLFDVIWVATKGSINKKNNQHLLEKKVSTDINIGYNNFGPNLQLTLSF